MFSSTSESEVVLTSFANFTGGVLLTIVALFVEKPEITIYPSEFYIALLWLAFIPAASFSIWYSLLQRPEVKVSELNMWKFVIPVTGVILSWLILPDENPTVTTVTGIIIITLALQLQQLPASFFKRRRKGKRA